MSEWVRYVQARLRLTGLLPEREAEIVEDLARQLEDAYEEALEGGASEPDARAAAHRHINDWPALARELERAERERRSHVIGGSHRLSDSSARPTRSLFVSVWNDLLRDVAYGIRVLRTRPGVTAVVLLTLALGIGANTAIFSVIDAVMLRAPPVRDPGQLVLLQWTAKKRPSTRNTSGSGDCPEGKGAGASGCSFSHPFVSSILAANTSFTGIAAFANAGRIAITGHGAASLASAAYVSGGYFSTLGVPPAAGRTLQTADDVPGAPPALVLSYGYWQRSLAGDPTIVGKTLSLNGQPFTVAGVADPRFTHLTPGYVFDLWIPLSSKPQLVARWDPKDDDADSLWIVIVARMKPDVGAAVAQAEITGLFRHHAMSGATPLFLDADDPKVALLPAQTGLAGVRTFFSQPLEILMVVVGAILLIACANVGGLMMSRAAARQKEMAVRLSLGASRGRLVRQGLTESLTLAVVGGALALVLAHWTTRLLVLMLATMAGGRDLELNTSLDVRVFVFTLGLSLLAGILFGIAPAWRGTQVELTPALKDGSRPAAGGRSRLSAGSVLVVTQVALTVVVLMGAGLLVRTLQNLRNVDAGFRTANLLTFGIDLTLAHTRGTTANQLSEDLQQRLTELPGVVAVSYSNDVLLSRSSYSTSFSKPGAPRVRAEADWLAVGPHFFDTLGLSILTGRDFRAEDYAEVVAVQRTPAANDTSPVAPTPVLVNQMFVKTYLPNVYPIGQVFGASTRSGGGWLIVGVASDSKYDDLRKDVVPTFYTALTGARYVMGARYFEVRTAQDPSFVMPSIRSITERMDLPIFAMKTEAQQIDQLLYLERLVAQLSGTFGLLALALASIGLYGLLSHEVSRRTREIGIRMALGAPRMSVQRLVVGQGLSLGLIGVGLGTVAGLGATRYLHSLLFGVGSGDLTTLASVTGLLICVSAAACIIPARRATRVDPLIALRHE